MCLNKRESTQPENASTQISDFSGEMDFERKALKDLFFFDFISLVFVKQIIYPSPSCNQLSWVS